MTDMLNSTAMTEKSSAQSRGGTGNRLDTLCCCEYENEHGERSHILACCCDCQALDEACDR